MPASAENYQDFFFLKSDPVNIRWSGHIQAPDFEKLKSWYLGRLEDAGRKIFLFYDGERILGYLYLDWIAEGNIAEIAYGTHSSVSGQGWGKKIVNFAIGNVEKYFPGTREVIAWIAEDNMGSIRCVLASGMQKMPDKILRTLPGFSQPLKFRKYSIKLNK